MCELPHLRRRQTATWRKTFLSHFNLIAVSQQQKQHGLGLAFLRMQFYVARPLTQFDNSLLTLLHSERPKLYAILAFLSATGLNGYHPFLFYHGFEHPKRSNMFPT